MSYALAIDGISKSYGAVRAVSSLNLRIAPGERVALIGASGSGKSTLIRLASGLLTGDSGEVRVFGEAIQRSGKLTKDARKIRRRIGLIFQKFNLVNRMSVTSNVLVGALGRISELRGTFGFYCRADREAAYSALCQVGIEQHAHKRAEALSGGQQQRAAIARALVQRAKVIIADEPIASLDPKSAKRVMDILADLNKTQGITLLVSLHQVDYARAYFDRVVAMRGGEIVFDGPSSKLTPEFLTELYGASAEELILPGQAGPAETHQPMTRNDAPAELTRAH
ncbi:phosphonates import ATP-binding protein PhnC 2 [Terrihabitans soli]|uniref:Phosphonates import ATP-binding protein PhnC 2 n=1 Tax=Terrihabitans soli TaxID=708113 RepID=A0A6S6QTC4_9HYPH|nr:phosphonate ABC transporter ATP-binding protein [Terrihabitans soli]BCJ89698.1 phosphonates import ATP-binding protein PhnC 2 [Terrihabitans soli]